MDFSSIQNSFSAAINSLPTALSDTADTLLVAKDAVLEAIQPPLAHLSDVFTQMKNDLSQLITEREAQKVTITNLSENCANLQSAFQNQLTINQTLTDQVSSLSSAATSHLSTQAAFQAAEILHKQLKVITAIGTLLISLGFIGHLCTQDESTKTKRAFQFVSLVGIATLITAVVQPHLALAAFQAMTKPLSAIRI